VSRAVLVYDQDGNGRLKGEAITPGRDVRRVISLLHPTTRVEIYQGEADTGLFLNIKEIVLLE
jgi:tRNA(Ile2) C34 agmatinyltransferase TiaS